MSAAQAKALAENVPEQGNGEIWGTREIKGYFEQGAKAIAEREKREGVAGVVHGDYKLDNLVCCSLCPYCASRDKKSPCRRTLQR